MVVIHAMSDRCRCVSLKFKISYITPVSRLWYPGVPWCTVWEQNITKYIVGAKYMVFIIIVKCLRLLLEGTWVPKRTLIQ